MKALLKKNIPIIYYIEKFKINIFMCVCVYNDICYDLKSVCLGRRHYKHEHMTTFFNYCYYYLDYRGDEAYLL